MAKLVHPDQEFFDKLNNDTFNEATIQTNQEIIINSDIVNFEFRTIRNVNFIEHVSISNVEINSGIEFINCEFRKGIDFDNVKSTNFKSTKNPNNFSVLFTSCQASHIVFTAGCVFDREIKIKNHSKIGDLNLYNTQINNASGLIIKETHIEGSIYVSNSKFDISISKSIISKQFRIETLTGNISLISSIFHNWVNFWNITSFSKILLNKNKFEDTFEIEGSSLNGFFIHGDTFDRKGTFENRDLQGKGKEASISEIYITEANFVEGFDFNGLGKPIEKITLPITPNFKGVLKFEGWVADNVTISGVNQDLKLLFKRNLFQFLIFNSFSNYGDLSFDKCKAFGDSTFNLINCDLGSAKLNEFDLESFVKIRVDNATIDNIKPASIKWFKKEALEIGIEEQTKKEEYQRKREFYRQIKQALKSNGNQIDSLIFQARELSAYNQELEVSERTSIGDKAIMWISKTNDYGLNWIKPVLIVFGITFLVYLSLLPYLSDKISYSPAVYFIDLKNTWNAFTSNFNVFWQLFNPIRKIKDTFTRTDSSWIYCLDLLHRIFLGIMIFQIIKAFRKFVSN
jgi:hypothetical protein